MIAIKEFIQQIVYVAIAVIIIELILPKGNTKKYVYVVLSLFILLNIVSPVINILKDVNMQNIYQDVLSNISSNKAQHSDDVVEAFSEYKNSKVEESLKNNIINEIEERLTNMNVKVKDIDISFNEEYSFENIEIHIENLDYLGDRRDEKILDIMTWLEKEYELPSNGINITEEAK